MIAIKQNDTKWRLQILNEEWEFKDRQTFEKVLLELIQMKYSFGQLQKGDKQ
jgi:hypothetical protein